MNHVEFLNHLFTGTQGYMDLTAIHPQTGTCRTRCYRIGQDRPDWERIIAANQQGWGIYYGLATKRERREGYQRGTEQTAFMLPAVWCEVDLKEGYYANLDAIKQAIYDMAQPATVITASGGGMHVLWRITPLEIMPDNLHVIKEVLRGMAIYLHADTKVADVARVLRLPGTVNTKPERNGARCEVIDALPGELTFDDFLEYRKYAQAIARPIARELPALPPSDDIPGCVHWYTAHAHPEGERNRSLNWTVYALFSNGHAEHQAAAWVTARALDDGLSQREVDAVIRSVYHGQRGTPSYVGARAAARMRAGDAVGRKSD